MKTNSVTRPSRIDADAKPENKARALIFAPNCPRCGRRVLFRVPMPAAVQSRKAVQPTPAAAQGEQQKGVPDAR